MAGFWHPAGTGLSIRLRVTPNADRDRIEGVETRADGEQVLRVRVRAVPDRGRANAAVLALLAAALGVPRRALTLASGETARLKTVAVATAGPAVLARLAGLAAGSPPGSPDDLAP